MITTHWLSGLNAFLGSMLLGPLVRILCIKLRVYDLPGPLKIHHQPIPRLGGVAIVLAMALGLTMSRLQTEHSGWFLLLAATLVWAAGLVDDVRGLRPAMRLVAQVAAGLFLVRGGWGISPFENVAANAGLTCLYVVLFINAFNFLDGSDGIAAGVAAIISIGYIAVPAVAPHTLGPTIAWSLLGACAGFLLFNFPPAKIFMGDSGSSMLGFATALLGFSFCQGHSAAKPALTPFLFSLLVAALPLVDAGLAVLRRIGSRASPLYGDRRHFYDLLLARKWTPRQVAYLCYALTGGLVIAGWFVLPLEPHEALITSALIGCTLFAIEVRMGALRSRDSTQNGRAKGDPLWRQMGGPCLREKI